MSGKAVRWAWVQQVKPASAKMVLLCLADAHNKNTGLCCPSVKTIYTRTGLDRKTVLSSIATLEKSGLIMSNKSRGAGTKYTLETSTNIGTTSTSPNIGTAKGKSSPNIPTDQSQYRDTNHKQPLKEYKYNSEQMKLAEWIWQHIQSVTQRKIPPNLNTWAEDIRKLNEIDGRGIRLIAEVFAWAHRDSFWSPNILSPAKLREKFDTLYAKHRGEANAKNQPGGDPAATGRKQTPAERVAAARELSHQRQLAARSPDVGAVEPNGGNVRAYLVQPAG